MAIDYIKIDISNPNAATQASTLKNAINTGQNFYALLLNIRQKMTHANNGVSFVEIETLYGLPSGKGQTMFDFVNGSIGAIEGTMQNNNIKSLTEQVV